MRINSKSKEENRLKVLIKSMQLQVNTCYIDLIGNGSIYQACLQMQYKSVSCNPCITKRWQFWCSFAILLLLWPIPHLEKWWNMKISNVNFILVPQKVSTTDNNLSYLIISKSWPCWMLDWFFDWTNWNESNSLAGYLFLREYKLK